MTIVRGMRVEELNDGELEELYQQLESEEPGSDEEMELVEAEMVRRHDQGLKEFTNEK